jgi:hypothetical protein
MEVTDQNQASEIKYSKGNDFMSVQILSVQKRAQPTRIREAISQFSEKNEFLSLCFDFLHHKAKINQLQKLDAITRYRYNCLICSSQFRLAVRKQGRCQKAKINSLKIAIGLIKRDTPECWLKTVQIL